MRYTYLGFNQQRAIELGLDGNDLTILRWFVDYRGTGKMIEKVIDGQIYNWVKYEAITEAFPIMNYKKDTVYRRMKKMVNKGVLKHSAIKNNGVYSFFALGENYLYLVDGCGSFTSGYPTDTNPNPTDTNPNPYGYKSVTKNKSINNKSININLLNKKEKEKKKKTGLDEIIENYTSNSELIETLQDFLKMRKSQKKSMTDRALKTLLKKLDTIATTDVEKIERLEESICNCWLTVYPKKQYNNSYNNKSYSNEELNTVTKEDYQQLQQEITDQIKYYEENKDWLDPDIDKIDF